MQLPYNRQGFPQIFWNILKPGPFLFNSCLSIPQTQFSGRSRPSDKGGGPGHPFGPSDIVWATNKGGRYPRAPPLDPYPLLRFSNFCKLWLLWIEDLTS